MRRAPLWCPSPHRPRPSHGPHGSSRPPGPSSPPRASCPTCSPGASSTTLPPRHGKWPPPGPGAPSLGCTPARPAPAYRGGRRGPRGGRGPGSRPGRSKAPQSEQGEEGDGTQGLVKSDGICTALFTSHVTEGFTYAHRTAPQPNVKRNNLKLIRAVFSSKSNLKKH